MPRQGCKSGGRPGSVGERVTLITGRPRGVCHGEGREEDGREKQWEVGRGEAPASWNQSTVSVSTIEIVVCGRKLRSLPE